MATKIKKPTSTSKTIENVTSNSNPIETNPQSFNNSVDLSKYSFVKHTEIVKRIIDACCFELQLNYFNGGSSKSLLETEKYCKLLQFRSKDNSSTALYDDVICLIKDSPLIINNVFDVMVQYIKLFIRQEMQTSNYVAMVLNQHGECVSELKISTCLRYMKNGILLERFVGFIEVVNRVSVDQLYNHFKETLQKYEFESKICALSIDGSILPITDLCKFLDKVRQSHPSCLFLPWHGHDITYILEQSLSSLSACRQFFMMIGGIQDYFKENSELLKELMNKSLPDLLHIYSPTDITSQSVSSKFASSLFIITVKNFRLDFIEIFNILIKTQHQIDDDSIIIILGFQSYLKDTKTIFLLEVFSTLLSQPSDFNNLLKNSDFKFCSGKRDNIIHDLLSNINRIFEGRYNEIWNYTVKKASLDLSETDKNMDLKKSFYSLFSDIISLTIQEIKIRYLPLSKLTFLSMFDFSNKKGPQKFSLFAQTLTEIQMQFCEEQIYNELVVFSTQYVYSKKSAIDFFNFLSEFYLHSIFKSLSNVSELIIVSLHKPTSYIQSSNMSMLQTISEYLLHDHLSILHIEQNFFETLRQMPSFYDDVLLVYTNRYPDAHISADSKSNSSECTTDIKEEIIESAEWTSENSGTTKDSPIIID